jgi:hypothetical protein
MKTIVLVLGLLLPSSGIADPLYAAEPVKPLYVHERPEVTIKLMPTSCVDPATHMLIASQIPDMLPQFRGLESNWAMKDGTRQDFGGCWLEIAGDLLIVFSDGTGTRISKAKFTHRKGMVGT